MPKTGVGANVIRKEAWDKVSGTAKYTDDYLPAGILTAKPVTSRYAHANLKHIDRSSALALPGVKAVVTGEDFPVLSGPQIADRPPLALRKVRYYGEPVALVVAENEFAAARAVSLVGVEYEPLPAVLSPSAAITPGAPLLHEELGTYRKAEETIYPEPGTNICDRRRIRKGDIQTGFAESEVIVEGRFSHPQSDQIAMEPRAAHARISPDGTVWIRSSSQAPYAVRKEISDVFGLELGKVIVETPFVGGGFGGKTAVQLELLAYMASRAAGGREVRIVNSREEDMVSSPCGMGLEATVRLGAAADGTLKAAEFRFLLDTGGYADIGPILTKALAADCTGPYGVEHVWCEALCIYTNHPYVTALRGFGHASLAFCMERMMDKLAHRLGMDPLELRIKNALTPGRTSPTQVRVTKSNLGDLKACVDKLKPLIGWEEGERQETGRKIRAKGAAFFWKTSHSPPDAGSGVLLTFHEDGGIQLNCGCVEIGPAMKTTAAQILAERLKTDIGRIQVNMDVNTKYCPKHWKTVASMTTYMVGTAVLRAVDDLVRQVKTLAAQILRCPPDTLEAEGERVYLRSDPSVYLTFKDLAHGYQYENGNSVGGQIIGRGSFLMNDLNILDRETGKGKSGPYWTVGAQAVEIEFDPEEYTYRLLKAASVIDAGRVINPAMAEGIVKGGMCMGLGLGSREGFAYDEAGKVLNTSLRTYKVMHFGETPQYLVDFVETPQADSPYGARGIGEHGMIGIPAAMANALSVAAGADLDELPLTPERIWKIKTGGIS